MEDTADSNHTGGDRHERHRHRHRHRSKSRSRSPRADKHQKTGHREGRREDGDGHKDDHRNSNRDGHRSQRHRHRHQHRSPSQRDRSGRKDNDAVLPHGARKLVSDKDYDTFEPLFAHYLDQEKQILLTDLESDAKKDSKKQREIQSRWRRFADKWNNHELDDYWYEPQLFLRAVRARDNGTSVAVGEAVSKTARKAVEAEVGGEGEEDDESDDSDFGPALPPDEGHAAATQSVSAIRSRHLGAPGPAIPSLADLAERRALAEEERDAERAAARLARRADRAEQRERLEELVPRAAAGTRERQLEKKRELNDKMRGFRDRSPGGGGLEVGDDELMGDDGGGSSRKNAQDVKKEAEAVQARRTYWQQRREEEQRARDEELNERRAQYRVREEETMDMLRELARQRFG